MNLPSVAGRVEFVERPMRADPHDQLLLQIRSAVAEYERTLLAERMRRGRQAKGRSGPLLPWPHAPYGYILDPARPRDPSRVRIAPVQAAVVEQMVPGDTDPGQPVSLSAVPLSAVAPAADGMRPTVHQEETVTERVQWGGANACACPALPCAFLNASSPACQVSCGASQSAVCQWATCQGVGEIVSLSGVNSCYCVAPPPRESPGGRSR